MKLFTSLCLSFLLCAIADCLADKESSEEFPGLIRRLWPNRDQEAPLVKRLWRNWDQDQEHSKEKRLWRHWDTDDTENEEMDREKRNPQTDNHRNVKRLWREEERGPICTTICPCQTNKYRRDVTSKRIPVPCCCWTLSDEFLQEVGAVYMSRTTELEWRFEMINFFIVSLNFVILWWMKKCLFFLTICFLFEKSMVFWNLFHRTNCIFVAFLKSMNLHQWNL